jgi:hypothetical protein
VQAFPNSYLAIMDLDNKLWASCKGAYNIPYDASRALRRLRDNSHPQDAKMIFAELWDNLHHQGNVELASYLAVPHLVSICISKNSFDWNYIGLCVVIENCRLKDHNPELVSEVESTYFDSLRTFESYLLLNFKSITDQTALRLSLALFATLRGQPDLGRAIELLDDGLLTKLLSQY